MSEMRQKVRRQALNRFFLKAGKWYVESREGMQGPFFRREEAVAHLERHIRRHGRSRNDEDIGLQGDFG